MRKLVCLICLFVLTSTFAFPAEVSRASYYNGILTSNNNFKVFCKNLKSNFKADYQFYEYISDRCMVFENQRLTLQSILYRFPNRYVENYNKIYNNLIVGYTEKQNNQEITNLKEVVTEYCKYNEHLHTKKNSAACSQETINGIFQTMP